MIKVALVALPVPVNQLYSYSMSEQENLVGYRVLVQFGTRMMTGVIVGYDDNIQARELKAINEVLDIKPFYSNEMLQFTKFIADYYLSSWGEALKLASPPGISSESNTFIEVNEDYSYDDLLNLRKSSPKSAEVFHYLVISKSKKINISSIKKTFKYSSVYSILENLDRKGFIKINSDIIVAPHIRKVKTLVIDPLFINNENYLMEELQKIEQKHPYQARLLSYIYIHQKDGKTVHQEIALDETKTERKDLQSLKNKKIILTKYIEDTVVSNNENISLSNVNELTLKLTNEQAFAIEELKKSINSNSFSPHYLQGVTGSGKTIVYLHLIREILEAGKSALILVPEISLTPQLIDRFKMSFGDAAAVLHSKMSDSDRIITWRQIAEGTLRIVIGARSTIFAPMVNLSLIIVDEEHDLSYKQESPSPRYNARDAAIVRANLENCTLILGSATPSVETYYNVLIGKFKKIELTTRADGAMLPKFIPIDMGEARKHGAVNGSLSTFLLDKVEEKVQKKEGVIIFQNRRGFSPVLRCNDCGIVYECEHCAIKLSYHKSRNVLRCHYCGYTIAYPDNCSSCGGSQFEAVGYGTQRIEDELIDYFKAKGIKISVDRMDMDTIRKKGNQRKILENFYTGKTDILVGTQIVTKGMNFDRVTLVGVINADLQLFQPDFRANEKTYQILTQVGGRAGRKAGMEGTVVIQTYTPRSYSIQSAINNQFDEFYQKELKIRKSALYPPYSRLILIEFYGDEEEMTHYYAVNFRRLLPPNEDNNLEIFGPFIPTMYKAAGNYRRLILIKADKSIDKSGNKIRALIKNALSNFHLNISPTTVMMKIDIDSYSQF